MADVILDELEAMASATMPSDHEFQPIQNDESTIRWQRLFNMRPDEAETAIQRFREDMNRVWLTAAQWDEMASATTASGHDKESLEYSLTLARGNSKRREGHSPGVQKRSYTANPHLRWIYIDPICQLDTPKKLRRAFPSYTGTVQTTKDEESRREFVLCDAHLKKLITEYLHIHAPIVGATFVEYSIAAKQLSFDSVYPTLGIDTTMPQFRATDGTFAQQTTTRQVQQDEYPVPYFFYGSLCDPERLARLLGLPSAPNIQEAYIQGGTLKEWVGSNGGQSYKALVDGLPDAIVSGGMVEIQNESQETVLRKYETGRYEVVRCLIKGHARPNVQGLTFRFVDCGELWCP